MNAKQVVGWFLFLSTLVSVVFSDNYQSILAWGDAGFAVFFLMRIRSGRASATDNSQRFAVLAIAFVDWYSSRDSKQFSFLSIIALLAIEAIVLLNEAITHRSRATQNEG